LDTGSCFPQEFAESLDDGGCALLHCEKHGRERREHREYQRAQNEYGHEIKLHVVSFLGVRSGLFYGLASFTLADVDTKHRSA